MSSWPPTRVHQIQDEKEQKPKTPQRSYSRAAHTTTPSTALLAARTKSELPPSKKKKVHWGLLGLGRQPAGRETGNHQAVPAQAPFCSAVLCSPPEFGDQ